MKKSDWVATFGCVAVLLICILAIVYIEDLVIQVISTIIAILMGVLIIYFTAEPIDKVKLMEPEIIDLNPKKLKKTAKSKKI